MTVDEIKALAEGDWVWVIHGNKAEYAQIKKPNSFFSRVEKNLKFYESGMIYPLPQCYESYGTAWTAYKNKEQAEQPEREYRPTDQMIAEACCNGICKGCEGLSTCYKEKNRAEPLTLDELKSLDKGTFVWVVDFANHYCGYQEINTYDDYGITWEAYKERKE